MRVEKRVYIFWPNPKWRMTKMSKIPKFFLHLTPSWQPSQGLGDSQVGSRRSGTGREFPHFVIRHFGLRLKTLYRRKVVHCNPHMYIACVLKPAWVRSCIDPTLSEHMNASYLCLTAKYWSAHFLVFLLPQSSFASIKCLKSSWARQKRSDGKINKKFEGILGVLPIPPPPPPANHLKSKQK
jgi:hypothetical protein